MNCNYIMQLYELDRHDVSFSGVENYVDLSFSLFICIKHRGKVIFVHSISVWFIPTMNSIGFPSHSWSQSEYGCQNSREISRVGKRNLGRCLLLTVLVCVQWIFCLAVGEICFAHSIVDLKDICCYFLCVQGVVGIPCVLLLVEHNQWHDRRGKKVMVNSCIDAFSALLLHMLINWLFSLWLNLCNNRRLIEQIPR